MDLKHLIAGSNNQFKRVTIAAGGVFIREDKILLITEDTTGIWQIPGGALDLKESLLEGAIREIMEEISVHAKLKEEPFVYLEKEDDELYILVHFLVESYKGEIRTGDIDEFKWFEFDKLPKTYPNIHAAIKYFDGK